MCASDRVRGRFEMAQLQFSLNTAEADLQKMKAILDFGSNNRIFEIEHYKLTIFQWEPGETRL